MRYKLAILLLGIILISGCNNTILSSNPINVDSIKIKDINNCWVGQGDITKPMNLNYDQDCILMKVELMNKVEKKLK